MPLRPGTPGNRRPFRARVGLDFPEWLGIRKEGDPSSNAGNQPRHLVNGRLVSGEIVCRGGQEDALGEDTVLKGCVSGIFAPGFQFPVVGRTLFHPGATTGIAAGRGTIWTWQIGSDEVFYYDTSLAGPIDDIAISDSNTIFATVRDGGSTKLYEIKLEPSTDTTDTNGSHAVLSATLRGTITQGSVESSSCCMLGTNVYVAHGTTGSTDARIYKWDGATFSSVDSPAIAHELLIRPDHASGLIVLRASDIPGSGGAGVRVMSSGGVWSAVTAPHNYRAFDVVVFNSATYIGAQVSADTHDCMALKWNGTIVSEELSLGEVSCKVVLAVAQGKLWIARATGDSDTSALLSSYDGTTFTNPFLDFTATGQTLTGIDGVLSMELIDDSLVMLVTGVSAGASTIILSPGPTFDDVWVEGINAIVDTADSATDPDRLHTTGGV